MNTASEPNVKGMRMLLNTSAAASVILKTQSAAGLAPTHELAVQALSLSIKHQHPAYDMLFVALAQRFGCTLLSVDSKLIAVARKIDATLVRN